MHDSAFKVNSSFVSERINKIRFIESENCLEPDAFVSGSSEGKIKLFKLIPIEFSDVEENDFTQKAVAKLAVDGDITGLEIVDHNNFVVSSGAGVSCIYLNRDLESNNLQQNFRFKDLHKFKINDPALCTGLSVFEDTIATIGEDGTVNLLSLSAQKVLMKLEDVDSVTPTAVNFINYKELITGNRLGIMNSYDLRSGTKEPTAVFPVSCDDEKKSNGVTCITNHPTQQHIVSRYFSVTFTAF